MSNLPPGVTDKMIDDHFGEPSGLFRVEIYTGIKENGGFDLWNEEIEWDKAVEEAECLATHNFKYRVTSMDGEKEFDV